VFHGRQGTGWTFERYRLEEPARLTLAALRSLDDLGCELRICTGRPRPEIEAPVARLGLERFFGPDSVTSATEVERAERLSGSKSLGKPHWFSPLCAMVGWETALEAVNGSLPAWPPGSFVYVGDARSDFEAVRGVRQLGLELHYVHVSSSVSDAAQLAAIAAEPSTLGVVDRLEQVPALLTGVAS
jgi:phosphoglycolate phosphatase-like HAD superfamily hydrolase